MSALNDITNGQNLNVFSFDTWLEKVHDWEGRDPNQIISLIESLKGQKLTHGQLAQVFERDLAVKIFKRDVDGAHQTLHRMFSLTKLFPDDHQVQAIVWIASAQFNFVKAQCSVDKVAKSIYLNEVDKQARIALQSLDLLPEKVGILRGKYCLLIGNLMAEHNWNDQALQGWHIAESIFRNLGYLYYAQETYLCRFSFLKPDWTLEQFGKIGDCFQIYPFLQYRFLFVKLEICKRNDSEGQWRNSYFETVKEAYATALNRLVPLRGIDAQEFNRISCMRNKIPGGMKNG